MALTDEDQTRIEAAVRRAEAKTSGQIVCVIAEEASRYSEVPLAWAAVAALLLPFAPLLLAGTAAWLDDGLRGWSAAHSSATHATVLAVLGGCALVQCTIFLLVVGLVTVPAVRRILTPAALRHGRVHARALEQFDARGLRKTHERMGVLLYISLKDRMAEVLADTGIHAKAGPDAWEAVIKRLKAGIAANKPADGFLAAIEACGEILAEHAPSTRAMSNELPDAVVQTP